MAKPPPAPPDAPTLLVVEDDVPSAFVLETILLKAGYRVLPIAGSSEQALELARAHRPDIILMDINIPGERDGVETAQAIRREIDVPLVYLTGFSDERTIERAKQTAPFAYILKPFREKEVAITIQMALYKSKADRKVRASEHRLAVTLGSLNDGVLSTDPRGHLTYMNPAAERLTGIGNEDASGLFIERVLTLRERVSGRALDNLPAFLFGEDNASRRNDPVTVVATDGTERIVQCQSSPTCDPNGTVTSWVVVMRDITERFEIERQHHIMASALESQEDAVLIFEVPEDGSAVRVVHANAAFEAITGYSNEEAIAGGLNILGNVHESVPGSEALDRCRRNETVLDGEGVYVGKGGREFQVAWSVSPVHADGGGLTHLVFTFRDTTRLRQLEENIRQSQKIEAIGRLAGGIAHDFNNLLSVINSYSELLSMKLSKDPQSSKYIKNIRTAGERGAALVNQLMTFARRESGTPTPLHLPDIVAETRKLLRPLIREDIRIEVELPDNLHAIRSDRSHLEQILVNLCLNARDAIEGAGSIRIGARNAHIDDHREDRKDYRIPGDYVVLEVMDTGAGMDEQVRTHLFEPFFTTKDIGKGTGLGLATVYGIVKQAGGYIEVDSEPGKGAAFAIYLPAVPEETPQRETAPAETPQPAARGSETILLVEDDETFADCISGLLSLHGYIVQCVNDGREAIQRFGPRAGEFRLLVADIVLPGADGAEVARTLAANNAHLKVIFMTGYNDAPEIEPPLPKDTLTLRKPFSLNSVLNSVRQALDSPRPTAGKAAASPIA